MRQGDDNEVMKKVNETWMQQKRLIRKRNGGPDDTRRRRQLGDSRQVSEAGVVPQ